LTWFFSLHVIGLRICYFSHHCDQIAAKQLKEERIYFGSVSKRSVHHQSAPCSGPVGSQIMAIGACRGWGYSPHGRQEAEWSSSTKGPGQDVAFKDKPPLAYFLQLGPTFHRPTTLNVLIVNENFEAVDGLNHSLGQSPLELSI
jgi:hypothetical protein